MENSTSTPTLRDFFTPGKSQRVWLVIFAALTSLMIIGASYEYSKPKPEPVRMTHETKDDVSAYLDVLLLSDWIYDVSGDENYTYYAAMDPDADWFIVSLDKDVYSSLSQHVDAYNAYFSDGYLTYDYPAPTRLTGMASYLDYDDTSALTSYYEVSDSDFKQYFGSCFFHEGANNDFATTALYLAGTAVFGLVLLAITLQNLSQRRHYRACDEHLYALGLTDEAENQFSDPATLRYPKMKLALSSDFAYVGSSGHLLPYTDIAWLYKRVQKNHGITVATQFMAGLVNGKTICLAARHASDELIADAAKRILTRNPGCIIGYSFDNAKAYYRRVKEWKANNPK